MLRLLAVLVLTGVWVNAQTITTQTFGTGPNEFSIDFVEIGNPGNNADTTGSPNPAGSVSYIYNIGKYEVSRDMIEKANSAGGLEIMMSDMGNYGGNGNLKPATGISWYGAAMFVNWLNISTGNTVAYKFDVNGNFQLWSAGDKGYNANNLFRNSLAKYAIASSDEWYKGAYGNLDGTWNNYPTGTDNPPTAVSGGTAANTGVFGQSSVTGPADINNAGGLSAYGSMGQGGNIWEWNETAYDGSNDAEGEGRVLRGGSWIDNSDVLDASYSGNGFLDPRISTVSLGFRVTMVPEPSSLSLLLAGGGVLMAGRRRKTD